MEIPKTKDLLLFLVALIFSAALMFAFVELPALLDAVLQRKIGFPDFDQGAGEFAAFKTDIYLSALHLRWIGYGSLALVLLLTAIGFATKKSGLAWAGAFVLFLPVFGQFALSMFFLAGLGMLRIIWVPFSGFSLSVLQLGDVIYLPHKALLWFLGLFGWQAQQFLTFLYMGIGSLLFVWGVFIWFRARANQDRVATGWLYALSRHPQYLGWIIWSYGFMLFSAGINDMKKSWAIPSSLPWLLATMIIIGICMMEEVKMKKDNGEAYEAYRQRTPFLFPLPSWLSRVIRFPIRLATGKNYPETLRQVIGVTAIYTVLLILPSLLWIKKAVPHVPQLTGTELVSVQHRIDSLLLEIQKPQHRRQLYPHIAALEDIGLQAAPVLIRLLKDDNPDVREFSAYALGHLKAEDAISPLGNLLRGPEGRPRRAAAEALGQIGSEQGVTLLMRTLKDNPDTGLRHSIYIALGNIGSAEAWDALVQGLNEEGWFVRRSALQALGKIDAPGSVPYLLQALEDEHPGVRREAVFIILKYKLPEAREGLKKALEDEDFETRFYARQALKILEDGV